MLETVEICVSQMPSQPLCQIWTPDQASSLPKDIHRLEVSSFVINSPDGMYNVIDIYFVGIIWGFYGPYGVIWGHMDPYGDPYKFSLLCAAHTRFFSANNVTPRILRVSF